MSRTVSTTIPIEFSDSIRQALKSLYDIGQMQRIVAPVARYGAVGERAINARLLQVEIVRAVDQLRPVTNSEYLSAEARLFNLIHGHYVEGLSVEHVARENAVSLRQAHRDLRRGEEAIVHLLWESLTGRLATHVPPRTTNESVDQEVASLGKQHEPLDLVAAIQRACGAVEPLAEFHHVALMHEAASQGVLASGNQAVAQQLLVSMLSFALQRARQQSVVSISAHTLDDARRIDIAFEEKGESPGALLLPEVIEKLVHHLGWRIEFATPGRIALFAIPSSRQVLVVDDNEGLIDLLSHYLGERGYDVIGCVQSVGALDAAVAIQPVFIVLDVMMPGQDGWQVLKMLKGNQMTRNIPVVICSVFEDRALARSLDAHCYLVKPVTRQSISGMLDEMDALMGVA